MNKKKVLILIGAIVAVFSISLIVSLFLFSSAKNLPDRRVFDRSSSATEAAPPPTEPPSLNEQLSSAEVGDTVTMGEHEVRIEENGVTSVKTVPIEWGVLDQTEDAVLLISTDKVDNHQFNDSEYQSVGVERTWETSSVRFWLNNEFYNSVFTQEEKAFILQTKLENRSFSVYADDGTTTYDRLFLLSVLEAEQYWDSSCTNLFQGSSAGSWLRSPGNEKYAPADIDNRGIIDYNGALSGYSLAIYPCMWLKKSDDPDFTEFDDFVCDVEPPEDLSEYQSGVCGDGGFNVKWSLDERGTLFIRGTGRMNDYQTYLHTRPRPWDEYRRRIHSVVIEDGVSYIGEEALSHAHSLREVYCKGTDYSIGPYAFTDCPSLEKVVLSDGLHTIMDGAFAGCTTLTELNIPDRTTGFGKDFISNCDELQTINGAPAEEWKSQHHYDSLPSINE